MSSSFFYTASTVAISSSSRDSMGSDSTISPTISCPSPVSTPGGSSTPTSSSSLELDGIVGYGLIASTGFFLCSTLILMIVVVFLGRKIRTYKKKSGADTMPRNPSYWITDTDLEPPRVSCSTPNLSDWSTPPLSRPARSFLDSERMDHDFYPPFGMRDRSNLVPSASMTPLVPQNRELAVKKSASHSDLSGPYQSIEARSNSALSRPPLFLRQKTGVPLCRPAKRRPSPCLAGKRGRRNRNLSHRPRSP
ncbi:hypothetical protein GBAR_LOCUS19223 [Geodia barretti]|uniref:Uncharacterized protein n=1 Tax=Geodia barretti TaxID=519541 RepID=A0AA35SQF5_GEOBA|nr:hypothetical protein GBAR_LOCUS19223 [Geodia barretti]